MASARFSEKTKEGGFPSGSVGFHKYGGRVSPTLWPHLGDLLNCLAKIPGSVGFHKYGGRRVSPTLCPIWEVRCSKRQQSKGGEGGGEHSRIAKVPGYPIMFHSGRVHTSYLHRNLIHTIHHYNYNYIHIQTSILQKKKNVLVFHQHGRLKT